MGVYNGIRPHRTILKSISPYIEVSFSIVRYLILFAKVFRFQKIFVFIFLVFLLTCCILVVSGENFDADAAKIPIAIQGMAETKGMNIIL